jgi:alkanesulfonate monooxygenase SsuD/methylene tetrahydromethanopterin reductase-like flavin-dependent oxidoreductase (luciferase family)
LRPGKPNSCTGVDKSLPVACEDARKAASTLVHTVCRPKSSGLLLQPAVTLKAGHPLGAELGERLADFGRLALAFPVHVASSRAQARAECEPGLLRFLRVATEAALPSVQGDPKSFEAFRQVRARMERVTYADMDREMGVFGDPEYCIARVRELQAEYGFDEFICYFNQGGLMDPALVKQSMTIFAREVIPQFR